MTRLFCISALCLLLAACSSGGDKSALPMLSVSIPPQQQILEELAGGRYEVSAVLPNGANPENFDPSMSQRMRLDKSAAYFTVGYLPFEDVLASGLNRDVKVFDTSAGIEAMMGTHDHGGTQVTEPDPHVWTSLRNGKVMARNMADALKQLDPQHAAEYEQRYAALAARIDSTDRALASRLADAGVHAFAVWHPSLSYFARDYGLHQISVGQESKEVSIGSMKEIVDEARGDDVRVFFFQKEFDSRQAENINHEIGSMLVTIDPMQRDWEKEIVNIADVLIREQQ